MHTWELFFLPLFLRKLLVSTRSSPGKLSCLVLHSTASSKAQKIPWLSRSGAPTGCKSAQTASNWRAKASLSSDVEKLACRVKRGRSRALWQGCFREELDIPPTSKTRAKRILYKALLFYSRFWWLVCMCVWYGRYKSARKSQLIETAIFVSSKF